MKKQIVLIEFENTCPFVREFFSQKQIEIEDVARFLELTEGFNPKRDSITFIDELTKIDLDRELLRLSK